MFKSIIFIFALLCLLNPSSQDCKILILVKDYFKKIYVWYLGNHLQSEFDYLKCNLSKKGKCPVVKMAQCFMKPEDKCQGDYDCPGIQKCCKEICGALVCQEPFFNLAKKPGICPTRPPGIMVKCMDPSTVKNECQTDKDCSGFKKCCKNFCDILVCESNIKV